MTLKSRPADGIAPCTSTSAGEPFGARELELVDRATFAASGCAERASTDAAGAPVGEVTSLLAALVDLAH
jgi:hypothetical protein